MNIGEILIGALEVAAITTMLSYSVGCTKTELTPAFLLTNEQKAAYCAEEYSWGTQEFEHCLLRLRHTKYQK